MNEHHEHCGSDEWRALIRDVVLPWALGDADLGEDVLEVGPGYGATTDVLAQGARQLTAVEIDPDLAEMLRARFAETPSVRIVLGDATALDLPNARFSGAASFTMLHHVPTAELQDRLFTEVLRVLRPNGVFVAADSVGSDGLAERHVGDTYNPIEPSQLAERLRTAGFTAIDVRINELGWAATARAPAGR